MTHALSVGPARGGIGDDVMETAGAPERLGGERLSPYMLFHCLDLPRRKDTLWCLYPMTAVWCVSSGSTRVAAKPALRNQAMPCVIFDSLFNERLS